MDWEQQILLSILGGSEPRIPPAIPPVNPPAELDNPDDEDRTQDDDPEIEEDDEEDSDPIEPEPEPEPDDWKPVGPTPIPGFWIDNNDYNREFSSWYSFVKSAELDPVGWKTKELVSKRANHRSGTASWHGTATFQDAIDMALNLGWPEGRELLQESLIAVAPRPKTYETLEFEVAGAYPCVPVYCAGDPACMVQDPGATMRAQKPIIRIDYNHWVHSGVTPRDMMLRGAAIISLADSLERQGFSTELRIIGNSSSAIDSRVFKYSIVYKEAGEPLDLDRAAFAIAHPASMRRLAFAILEQHANLERGFKGGYGYPQYGPNDPTSGKPGGAIFIPGSRGGETPDSANRAVQKAASALLETLEKLAEAAD